jgi:sporulation protein YlmC with PRC-barrel domain
MDLIRDVLDNQLVDRNQRPLGKVDAIVIKIEDNNQPVVTHIQSSLPVALARLHPTLGRWARALGRRFGLRRGRPLIIPWHKIQDVGLDVEADIDADHTEALVWETWLKETIVKKIPGSE